LNVGKAPAAAEVPHFRVLGGRPGLPGQVAAPQFCEVQGVAVAPLFDLPPKNNILVLKAFRAKTVGGALPPEQNFIQDRDRGDVRAERSL
jgi:hypothetical protein